MIDDNHKKTVSQYGSDQNDDHKRTGGQHAGGQKSSEGGRGDSNKTSPATVERYIKGIHFPANKQDLINQAKENGASQDVMNVLDRFEDQDYNSAVDVAKEVGRAESGG